MARFRTADRFMRYLMAAAAASPGVLEQAGTATRLQELRQTKASLQATRRSLSDLFRSLRAANPRLHLLADRELFLMLTHARAPAALQPVRRRPPLKPRTSSRPRLHPPSTLRARVCAPAGRDAGGLLHGRLLRLQVHRQGRLGRHRLLAARVALRHQGGPAFTSTSTTTMNSSTTSATDSWASG